MRPKCCVPGCSGLINNMHKIPLSKERRDRWLRYLNVVDVGSFMYVCRKHFESKFITEKHRLICTAYPTLFTDEEISSGIPSRNIIEHDKENITSDHSYPMQRHHDHAYCKLQPMQLTQEYEDFGLEIECATSKECEVLQKPLEELNIDYGLEKEYGQLSTSIKSEVLQKTLEEINIDNGLEKEYGQLSTSKESEVLEKPPEEFNFDDSLDREYTQSPSSKKSEVLQKPIEELNIANVPKLKTKSRNYIKKFKALTPQSETLYRAIKKSQRQLEYAKRTIRARKAMINFENLLEKMHPLSKRFISMQFKMITKSKKARRFSTDEKLLALSIMKQSPKCYGYLQKIFILPSKTTLNKMIGSFKSQAGINNNPCDSINETEATVPLDV